MISRRPHLVRELEYVTYFADDGTIHEAVVNHVWQSEYARLDLGVIGLGVRIGVRFGTNPGDWNWHPYATAPTI